MRLTGAVYLRALELSDIERCHAWHNDPELFASLGGPFRYVSSLAEEAWLRRKAEYSTTEVSLAICRSDNDQHIGNVYLADIDWLARRTTLSIFVGPASERGQGFGRSALDQALRHATDDLGLEKVCLEVLTSNTGAIRLYEGAGFAIEGTLRMHVFKRGSRHDVHAMAYFRPSS